MKTISHTTRFPFEVTCLTDVGNVVIKCHQGLRIFPERRIVCDAFVNEEPVIAKIFDRHADGEKQAQLEAGGIIELILRKVLTATIIHKGQSEDGRFSIIVYKKIADAQTIRDAWQQQKDEAIISQFVELLAQHHVAGVLHQDMHLNNFLLSAGRIYTLDTVDMDFHPQAITKQQGLQQLAQALSLFRVEKDEQIQKYLQQYLQLRDLSATTNDVDKVKSAMRISLLAQQHSYLKKIYRDCSEFISQKRFGWYYVYLRRLQSDQFEQFVHNPNAMFNPSTANMQKDGNTCTVISCQVDGHDVIIKRYNIKGVLHALKRLWRPTRASHSWRNAHMLTAVYGIPTAQPLALIEKRFGPLRLTSWFVMQHIEGVSAHELFNNNDLSLEMKRNYAEQLAAIFMRMARFQISHGDMKATNFLFKDEQFFLIDLDGMKQHDNAAAFQSSFRRDLQRFMKNWQHSAELTSMFIEVLAQDALRPCFQAPN